MRKVVDIPYDMIAQPIDASAFFSGCCRGFGGRFWLLGCLVLWVAIERWFGGPANANCQSLFLHGRAVCHGQVLT